MIMDTQNIWQKFGDEFFFFILKRVQNEEMAKEILQNSFLKIHKNLPSLKDNSKVRSWAYQILRNEIINFHNNNSHLVEPSGKELQELEIPVDSYCCFEKFIHDLPPNFHAVINEVYIKGNSQAETAEVLKISLANTKARVRRAKEILKKKFQECCKYELDSQGLLTGEPNCGSCQ